MENTINNEELAKMIKDGFSAVDDLAIMVKKGFDETGDRLGKVEQRLGNVEARLDSLVYRFEFYALEQRVESLELKLKEKN